MNSREKLLAATRACLLELGHGATTIKAIATRAGVNHGLIHHYFGSKENLVLEVVSMEQKTLLEKVTSQPNENVIPTIIRELVENPERAGLFVEILSLAGQMPQAAEGVRNALRVRDEMIHKKMGVEDPGLRWLVGSALLGLALTRRIEPNVPVDKVVQQIHKIMIKHKQQS